jgi:hypothetical protein
MKAGTYGYIDLVAGRRLMRFHLLSERISNWYLGLGYLGRPKVLMASSSQSFSANPSLCKLTRPRRENAQ